MNQQHSHHHIIARDLGLTLDQVQRTAALLTEGATVPFIARYRKEATGSLDEVFIAQIRDRLATLIELDKRRMAILESLEGRDILTEELHKQLLAATGLTALEDIYLPLPPETADTRHDRSGKRPVPIGPGDFFPEKRPAGTFS